MAARPPSKTSGDIVADLTDGVNELKISQATADDEPVKAKQEDQVDSASSPKDDDGKGDDVVQEEISFFCWNIDGNEKNAALREQVTQATFKDVVGDGSFDVICLQEVNFQLELYTNCFEIRLNEYGYLTTKECNGVYHSILFKKDKFEKPDDCVYSTYKEAFQLMDCKKIFYEEISKNEAAEMSVAGLGEGVILERMKITKEPATTTQKSLCDEIQSECRSVIKSVILPRYQGGEVDESLKDFVNRRAAMAVKRLKSQKLNVLVISLHSPRKAEAGSITKKGQESVAARFAYLLFDFLDKFELIANAKNDGINMCVVIAGDFNTDIMKIDCLKKFVKKYDCPNYALDKLRTSDINDGAYSLQKMDFMLFRNFSPNHTAGLTEVAASALTIPDSVWPELPQDKTPIQQMRSITSHNPLTGNVQVETARKGKTIVTKLKFRED